ncbi:hypothetical protein RB595_001391 [Gaeumannomyces hyphopodioides]
MAYYQAFGLTCPDEGKFYVCEKATVQFIGCCTSDPCADGSGKCPQANLRKSNFSPSEYHSLPEQDCDGYPRDKNWYTCAGSRFMGCCATNPCSPNSCPNDKLLPAKLSDKTINRNLFLNPTSSGVPTSTASNPATGTALPNTPEVQQQNNGLSTGAIAGIAVGVGLLFIILIAVLTYKFGWSAGKRKERKKAPILPHMSQPEYDPNDMAPEYDGSHKSATAQANPFRESYMSSTAFSSPRDTMFSKHHQSMGTLSPDGPRSAYAASEGDPRQPSPSYSQLSFNSNVNTPQLGAAPNLPVVYEMDSTSRPHELASSDAPASPGLQVPGSPQNNPQFMQQRHVRGPSFDSPMTSPGHPPASPLFSEADAGSQYGSPAGSPRMPPNTQPHSGGYASVPGGSNTDFGHDQNQGYRPYNAPPGPRE